MPHTREKWSFVFAHQYMRAVWGVINGPKSRETCMKEQIKTLLSTSIVLICIDAWSSPLAPSISRNAASRRQSCLEKSWMQIIVQPNVSAFRTQNQFRTHLSFTLSLSLTLVNARSIDWRVQLPDIFHEKRSKLETRPSMRTFPHEDFFSWTLNLHARQPLIRRVPQ